VKNGKLDEFNIWGDAQRLMSKPVKFLEILNKFILKVEKFEVPERNFKSI